MKEQYRRLMQGFVASRPEDPGPDDLLEALRGLPEVGQLPPPWVTWTLVRLVDRLGSGSTTTISERESAEAWWREKDAARPDPGYPHFEIDRDNEWEHHTGYGYSFQYPKPNDLTAYPSLYPINHWMNGRLPFVFVPEFLVNSVYLYFIDPSHGQRYLYTTTKGFIAPSTATAELGVAELEAAGLVERVLIREGSFGHSLTPAALEHAAAIAAFSGGWCSRYNEYGRGVTPAKRVRLAAAIGDWPAAHAAAIDIDRTDGTQCPELVAFTRERAGRCRARRDADPRVRDRVCDIATAVLRGGYPSNTRQFSGEFWEAIRSAPPWVPLGVFTEFRTDERGDDVPWPPGVQRLLDHALPLGRLPRQWIDYSCDGATPRQRREIIRVFARDETMLAEAAYRAFSDAPEQAEALLRRGLRSPSLRSRIYTAGLLGAIDEPWSHRELWQAIQEHSDPKETVNLRAALRCSRDWDVKRALEAWEVRHGVRNSSPWDYFPSEDFPVRKRLCYFKNKIESTTYPLRFRAIRKWGRKGRYEQDQWRRILRDRDALQCVPTIDPLRREL
jgi:hypothetical protein